jgi:HrpA-like RNA helicase
MLSAFEDFLQKRSFGKLVSLAKAKAGLPIAPFCDDIAAAVRDNPVTVLAGDTGCGKSTQVPQFLLRAGFGRVAVTQPRRLAATALAARVGYETLRAHGAAVGYRVRFDAAASACSAVVFCTEGVLLRCVPADVAAVRFACALCALHASDPLCTPCIFRELASDPLLARYDVVVVDEAHERHISTDLLLGLLKARAHGHTRTRLDFQDCARSHAPACVPRAAAGAPAAQLARGGHVRHDRRGQVRRLF